jgi:hypothetical protein
MLLKGEALIHSITIGFTVNGEAGAWNINVSAPGNITSESETAENTPYGLLDEMLSAAFDTVCRRFPERAPRIRSGARR